MVIIIPIVILAVAFVSTIVLAFVQKDQIESEKKYYGIVINILFIIMLSVVLFFAVLFFKSFIGL